MTVKLLEQTDAITYIQGDPRRILLHVVNCRGVMGSGIAAQIKKRIPAGYKVYRDHFENGDLELGVVTAQDSVVNMAAQDNLVAANA